jgi:hypothetical protein
VIDLPMALCIAAVAETYGSKPIPDQDRGTGRTTRQMQTAPQDAAFVWHDGRLDYPRDLAKALGRPDLIILSPSDFDAGRQRGKVFTGVVIDHWAKLSHEQWREVYHAREASLHAA